MIVSRPTALILALRNTFEHNPAIVYKAVYLGETISLIESEGWRAECLDVDIDHVTRTKLISALAEKPKILLIWAEVHHAPLALHVAETCKRVSPDTKVFVYGRSTAFIPQYFERAPFDAVHADGDREAAITSYLRYVDGRSGELIGVSAPAEAGGSFVRHKGERLPPEQWPLPALSKVAVEKYRAFSEDEHGLDYSYRLAATVGKGCEWSCAYCGAPQEEGSIDRRRAVEPIFDWIRSSGFEGRHAMLHLFIPNLFADHAWVREFCKRYIELGCGFEWRAVTTIKSILDHDIVQLAGAAGCREIAVGVETLVTSSGRTAKSTLAELDAAVRNAHGADISIKGLVMLGYPGQTDADIIELERLAQNWRIPLRYTGYTPLHRLKRLSCDQLDRMDLPAFDRRTYFDAEKSALSREFFYNRITANGGYFFPEGSVPIQAGMAIPQDRSLAHC